MSRTRKLPRVQSVCGSVCNLFSMAYNHHPQVESGLMEEECAAELKEFFKNLRLTLPNRKRWRRPTSDE